MFRELFFLHCSFSFSEPFGHLWLRRFICPFSVTQRMIWKWYLKTCSRLLINWHWFWRNSVLGKIKVSPARGVFIWCLAGSICHMPKASSDCTSRRDLVSRKLSLSNCCLLGTYYFLISMQICSFIYFWFSVLQSRVASLWFLQASKFCAVPPHHPHTIHSKSGQEDSVKFRPWDFSLGLAAVKVGLSPLEPF